MLKELLKELAELCNMKLCACKSDVECILEQTGYLPDDAKKYESMGIIELSELIEYVKEEQSKINANINEIKRNAIEKLKNSGMSWATVLLRSKLHSLRIHSESLSEKEDLLVYLLRLIEDKKMTALKEELKKVGVNKLEKGKNEITLYLD